MISAVADAEHDHAVEGMAIPLVLTSPLSVGAGFQESLAVPVRIALLFMPEQYY